MFPRCRHWRAMLLALTLCATLTNTSSSTVFVPDHQPTTSLAQAKTTRVSLWT